MVDFCSSLHLPFTCLFLQTNLLEEGYTYPNYDFLEQDTLEYRCKYTSTEYSSTERTFRIAEKTPQL